MPAASEASSPFDTPGARAMLARARQRIAGQRDVLRSLEGHALDLHAAGDVHAAVAAVSATARYASASPTGVFAGPELERVLLELGRERVADLPPRPRPAAPDEHVLHVFTETYASGGHTRLAYRWMQLDGGRRHSAVVTRPVDAIPAELEDAVGRRGGEIVLCSPTEPPLRRAAVLRSAAAVADVVVLHTHMYDAVPLLALAGADRPPVVVMNHADHVFWLGAGIADAVAEIRAAGAEWTVAHRGVPRERTFPLGIPLGRPVPRDRAAARRRLGLDADRPLLATVASGYKVAPILEPSLPELIARAVLAVPDALCLVVGSDEDEAWAQARSATRGRVLTIPWHPDPGTLTEAADVYLEAWPCSSGTSLLEAGARGVPVVAFAPDPGAQGMLALSTATVADVVVSCGGPEAYVDTIATLLTDPGERARAGTAIRERVVDRHAGRGWTDMVERVVAAARARPPARPLDGAVPASPITTWEATLQVLHERAGLLLGPEQALSAQACDPEGWRRRTGRAVRRAVAGPRLDRGSVLAVVDAFRALVHTGAVGCCVVGLPRDRVAEGCALLETALAEGDDVDIDVTPVQRLADILGPADLCVAEAGSAAARDAEGVGAELHVLGAVG